MKKSVKITDLSYSFLPHPVTGNISLVKNEDAIKQSIKTLIFLNLYEKPYKNDINIGIKYFLFENINAIDKDELEESISNILAVYEPRIILNFVLVNYSESNNTINVVIDYSIIGETPIPDSVSFTFGISR